MMHGSRGHTLIETLICVAIIAILMAMYLPALSRARRQAEGVSIREGMRQEHIGHLASTANSAGSSQAYSASACREAFRTKMNTGVGDVWMTQPLYIVTNENEFRAYWHTFIAPGATGSVETEGGAVTAYDDEGNAYRLPSIDAYTGPAVPMAWEFISTDLGETSSGTLGCSVLYTDGHVAYATYPHRFPAVPIVAELSHAFMEAQ